jgi:hypothetical protein
MEKKKNSFDGACRWKRLQSLENDWFHFTNVFDNAFAPKPEIPVNTA